TAGRVLATEANVCCVNIAARAISIVDNVAPLPTSSDGRLQDGRPPVPADSGRMMERDRQQRRTIAACSWLVGWIDEPDETGGLSDEDDARAAGRGRASIWRSER